MLTYDPFVSLAGLFVTIPSLQFNRFVSNRLIQKEAKFSIRMRIGLTDK